MNRPFFKGQLVLSLYRAVAIDKVIRGEVYVVDRFDGLFVWLRGQRYGWRANRFRPLTYAEAARLGWRTG